MRRLLAPPYLLLAILLTSFVYFVSCAHDDDYFSTNTAPAITRGTDLVQLDKGWTFDKAHSNVMWETAYMGSGALLTGRFNQFGFTSFSFDESDPANTSFEAWVRLNSVNTGEPGRDDGCLLKTFGTDATKVDESENLAIIKSRKIELSTTDKGYIVTMDMTFLGKTKEVKGKLTYTGKTSIAAATPYDLSGLALEFQIFAKSDFGVVSTSIADKVGIKCNAQFKKS